MITGKDMRSEDKFEKIVQYRNCNNFMFTTDKVLRKEYILRAGWRSGSALGS